MTCYNFFTLVLNINSLLPHSVTLTQRSRDHIHLAFKRIRDCGCWLMFAIGADIWRVQAHTEGGGAAQIKSNQIKCISRTARVVIRYG